MLQALISPPRTLMEVFKMLPEGTLAEIINNQLYMSPSPIGKHQRIVTRLTIQIGSFVESKKSGELLVSPFDVYLDEEANVVQPDLIFVSRENLQIVDDDGVIHGVPDMLIEVLSPGNPDYDTKTKKDLYERFGVKEYWIVDPATKSTIGYTLAEKKYQKIDSVPGIINSLLLNYSFDF
jgi:Uma2 family endonuclease